MAMAPRGSAPRCGTGRTHRRVGRAAALVAGAGAALLTLGTASPEAAWLGLGGAPRETSRRALLGAGLLSALGGAAGPAAALTESERRTVAMFKHASSSVMGVSPNPAAREDEAPPILGSAFVWDENHVVTNFHVIDEMATPYVTFVDPASDGKRHLTLPTVVVGADPLSDIAVLEVQDDRALKPLPRGSSSALLPGQQVYALGNPFGLESSMSKGVVSGVSRTMSSSGGRPIRGVIQSDTSVNPGNSGGPLLNSDGAVVGINAAILSRTGSFSGVSLAIPIDTAEKNVRSMLAKGFVSRASMGIIFAPDEMTKDLELEGAMVMRIYPGGPAFQAGVRPMRRGHLGDMVVAIDGTPVGSSDDVFRLLDQKAPGEDVIVSVQRPSVNEDSDAPETLQVSVSLGASAPPPSKAMLLNVARAMSANHP
mmetsp:Transcript_2654/g.6870  ORF Transcript_2654/g.6870 Transcript_2654/m.6870 type:complete len:425 (-) Transcript_2654:177-1451(-)